MKKLNNKFTRVVGAFVRVLDKYEVYKQVR